MAGNQEKDSAKRPHSSKTGGPDGRNTARKHPKSKPHSSKNSPGSASSKNSHVSKKDLKPSSDKKVLRIVPSGKNRCNAPVQACPCTPKACRAISPDPEGIECAVKLMLDMLPNCSISRSTIPSSNKSATLVFKTRPSVSLLPPCEHLCIIDKSSKKVSSKQSSHKDLDRKKSTFEKPVQKKSTMEKSMQKGKLPTGYREAEKSAPKPRFCKTLKEVEKTPVCENLQTKKPSSSLAHKCQASSSWFDSPEQRSLQQSFLNEINARRKSLSLAPLKLHPLLNECAAKHNYDQAFNMNGIYHVGSDGSRLSERLKRAGYSARWAGENVAHRQKTVKWAVNSLMKSPGHRQNIVNESATEMGIHGGVGKDGYWYWTQILAERKSSDK